MAEEKAKPFVSDSAYERLHAEPINIARAVHPIETDLIEPESPTAIKIINPTTQTYQSSHTESLSNSYDYKETDSSISKATDSSSIASTTTTNSSNSSPNQITSQPSQSESMHSSISSVHNSVMNLQIEEDAEHKGDAEHEKEIEREEDNTGDAEIEENSNENENDLELRIQEMTSIETERILRIQELETRCASLEEKVSALTL